jgi:hypothetical protein
MLNSNAIKWHYCGVNGWAEASSFGIPVGRFPKWMRVDGIVFTGTKIVRDADGDVKYTEYTDGKRVLRIFND